VLKSFLRNLSFILCTSTACLAMEDDRNVQSTKFINLCFKRPSLSDQQDDFIGLVCCLNNEKKVPAYFTDILEQGPSYIQTFEKFLGFMTMTNSIGPSLLENAPGYASLKPLLNSLLKPISESVESSESQESIKKVENLFL